MTETKADEPIPDLTTPVRLLIGIILIEAIAMFGVAALLVYEIFTQPSLSVASSIALIVLALIATAALAAIALGIYRAQPWTRGASIVWQVLQAAAAVVVLQGDMADGIGWILAGLSLAGLLLVFHPAVTARLRHREERPRDDR